MAARTMHASPLMTSSRRTSRPARTSVLQLVLMWSSSRVRSCSSCKNAHARPHAPCRPHGRPRRDLAGHQRTALLARYHTLILRSDAHILLNVAQIVPHLAPACLRDAQRICVLPPISCSMPSRSCMTSALVVSRSTHRVQRPLLGILRHLLDVRLLQRGTLEVLLGA